MLVAGSDLAAPIFGPFTFRYWQREAVGLNRGIGVGLAGQASRFPQVFLKSFSPLLRISFVSSSRLTHVCLEASVLLSVILQGRAPFSCYLFRGDVLPRWFRSCE